MKAQSLQAEPAVLRTALAGFANWRPGKVHHAAHHVNGSYSLQRKAVDQADR
jgi:hypothetical protein